MKLVLEKFVGKAKDIKGADGIPGALVLNIENGELFYYDENGKKQDVTVSGVTLDTENGTLSFSGDISSSGSITATGSVDAGSTLSTGIYTVATLPAGALGDRAMVSDALTPSFGAAVTGGGAVNIPVYHDGAGWKVG